MSKRKSIIITVVIMLFFYTFVMASPSVFDFIPGEIYQKMSFLGWMFDNEDLFIFFFNVNICAIIGNFVYSYLRSRD